MGAADLPTDASDLWRRVTEAIRSEVPEATWNVCFEPSSGLAMGDGILQVAVPSLLVKQRIEARWLDSIQNALAALDQSQLSFEMVVRPTSTPREGLWSAVGDETITASEPDGSEDVPVPSPRVSDDSAVQALNPRYTFENFVTGAGNRFAHAAALSVAEIPARGYNPLFIYGGAGLGKTHLLHAIGHYVQQNYPAYKVRYVSTEVFLNDYVEAIRMNSMLAFKRKYRNIDVLLVDDIQFMEGKEGLQEEFFHTFNQLHGDNRQIVLSSDRPPRAINALEDRLRSRFEWGLITDIPPPDLETRLAILRNKAEREPTPPPAEVLEFIATNVTNNIRELEGALIRVSAFARLNRQPLSTDLAAEVLSDILSGKARKPFNAAEAILEATSDMFGFSIEELQGKSRRRPLVTARQIAMYVCRELTDLTYPDIAREFGGRDHTTVAHAVEKISALMKERRQIYDQVVQLMLSARAHFANQASEEPGLADNEQTPGPADNEQTPGPLERWAAQLGLAQTLLLRFKKHADAVDLENAISMLGELALAKLDDSLYHARVNALLADALQNRYQVCGNGEDLERAIACYQQALALDERRDKSKEVARGGELTTQSTVENPAVQDRCSP